MLSSNNQWSKLYENNKKAEIHPEKIENQDQERRWKFTLDLYLLSVLPIENIVQSKCLKVFFLYRLMR